MSKDVAEWTADDFRPHVGAVIADLREGNLYTELGLTEIDYILEDGEKPPPRTEKKHDFNKLLDYVALKLVKDNGWEKKSKKGIFKQLYEFRDEWADEIRRYPPPGSVTAATNAEMTTPISKEGGRDTRKYIKHDSDEDDDEDDDDMQESEEAVEERSKALAAASPAAENQSEQQQNSNEDSDEKMTKKQKEEKEIFEAEREEILKEIPDDVKSKFGQIMFSRWSKETFPVLVMSPFQVAPGRVRDLWYTMYDKVKKGDRLGNMSNLVYWYGAYPDPPSAYSFLANNKLISYEDGLKKGYDQLPKGKNKKVSDQLTRGLAEMKEDLQKEPEERCGRMGLDFLEVYMLPDESEDETDVQPKVPKKRGRQKQSDLTKAEKQSKSTAATKKIKIKKKPGRKRKEPEPEEAADLPAAKTKKKKTGKKAKQEIEDVEEKNDKKKPKPILNVEDDFAEDDISSHDDKDDEDIEEPATESDEDDDDFELEPQTFKSKKKPGPKPKKKKPELKEPPKKKLSKVKVKKKEAVNPEAKVKKAPSMLKMKKMEQAKFAECERTYLPIIQRWETALAKEDVSALDDIYGDLLALVGQFSAPFIEEYGLYPLIKKSKQIRDGPNRKKLYHALKAAYTEKKGEVPEGFKPSKSDIALAALKRGIDKPTKQKQEKREKKKEKEEKKEQEVKHEPTEKKEHGDDAEVETESKDTVAEAKEKAPQDIPSAAASPAIKRTGSMENVSAPEQDSKSGLAQKKEAPAKVVLKKKFSLGSLMRPASSTPKVPSKSTLKQSSSSGQLSQQQKKMPAWISQSSTDSPEDPNRLYALQFFRQAAPYIPQSKHVNHDAIALALEAAVYEWVGADGGQGGTEAKWLGKYWEKVHEIVASISGKRGISGTIAARIAEGRFKSPDEIVRLPEDVHIDSFEGRSVAI